MYNLRRIMLGNLRALFGVIGDIALLRRGPDSLPASTALLLVVIAVHAVVSAIMRLTLSDPPASWPLPILAGTALTLWCFDIALRIAGKRERFTQTMTAWFCMSALFLPALAPILVTLESYIAKPEAGSAAPYALYLLFMLLGGWLVVVMVRIIRAAFDWNYLISTIFFLGFQFGGYVILTLLFGVAAKPA